MCLTNNTALSNIVGRFYRSHGFHRCVVRETLPDGLAECGESS
jgi:hypothetical protein